MSPPPREQRIAQLRELMGEGDPSVVEMTVGIRWVTTRNYERYVMPLIRQHWPAVLDDPFAVKLRLATCHLYASAPYTVLFSAPNRPLCIRLITDVANRLRISNRCLGLGARAAMKLLGRVALQSEHRRIVLVAAFIATVDHAFDHCMDDPPEERGRKMHDLLDGNWCPDTPPLQLVRALQLAMSHALSSEERPMYESAVERLKDWVDSEVAGMVGVDDPSGLGHRLAGIEGTIDGLLFPVYRWAGEAARRWMYDVSLFVQMMDDYLDYETDKASDRITPIITGQWTWEHIAEAWHNTVHGIEELTRGAGLHAPHYVRFVREAYVLMLCEALEGMAMGIAD